VYRSGESFLKCLRQFTPFDWWFGVWNCPPFILISDVQSALLLVSWWIRWAWLLERLLLVEVLWWEGPDLQRSFPYPSLPLWKHAQVTSIHKPGKDPALSSSYRPISLLDTIGKLFEKILLARILHVVSDRGLLWDEQFGFRPRHSTSLQLARFIERITRNFGEKRLTGAVFLDVAKAFDTVWIDGLLYKLTLFNFPSYIVHTISSCLRDRTFEASFQTATSSRRGMKAGVAQGGLISPVLFSLSTTCPHPRTTSS